MEEYIIFNLTDNECNLFCIPLSFIGMIHFIGKVGEILPDGVVVIDRLLAFGNCKKRLFVFNCKDGQIDLNSARHLKINKKYSEITYRELRKREDVVNDSDLTALQKKRLLTKGHI